MWTGHPFNTSKMDLIHHLLVPPHQIIETSRCMRKCPNNRQDNGNGGNRAQSSSAAPLDKAAPRGTTLGTRKEANHLFDILPEKLLEPFSVSTLVGEFILAERVYYDCTIFVNHKNTVDDLVELDMVDFDVILGMFWLHAGYSSVNCRNRVVKFQFPNELVIEWRSSSTVPKGHFITYLKARKFVSKGCIYHLVRVNDSSVETPPIQSVPVVSEFPDVFPNDLTRVLSRPEPTPWM
uniref:Gag-pol protein, putative n=1 Tax=Solanum demissum TaxID=50514 RepID=Q6L3R7_SOLDE|nr:Gag-pol protein, putative [Solanum demissum]